MKTIDFNVLMAMCLGLIAALFSWLISAPIFDTSSIWLLVLLFVLGAAIVLNLNKLPMTFRILRHYLFWPCLGLNLGGILNYYFAFLSHGNMIAFILITMIAITHCLLKFQKGKSI